MTIRFRERINAKYRRRLEKLVCNASRLRIRLRNAGRNLLPVREITERNSHAAKHFAAAEDATRHLIEQFGIVTVPWDDAGAYLRFSVTYVAATEADEDALMAETKKRLGDAGLVW